MKSQDSSTINVREISELLAKIEEAKDKYEVAKQEATFARSAEASALNTLNSLQKRFDENVEKWKDTLSPSDSDWARAKRTYSVKEDWI